MNITNLLQELQSIIDEFIHLQQQKIAFIQKQEYEKVAALRDKEVPIKRSGQQHIDELLKQKWSFHILIDSHLLRPLNSLLIKDIASAQYIIDLLGMPNKISCSIHLDNLEEFVQWLIICTLKKDYILPELDLMDTNREHHCHILMDKFNRRDKWQQGV